MGEQVDPQMSVYSNRETIPKTPWNHENWPKPLGWSGTTCGRPSERSPPLSALSRVLQWVLRELKVYFSQVVVMRTPVQLNGMSTV